jgi:hypothetical protein
MISVNYRKTKIVMANVSVKCLAFLHIYGVPGSYITLEGLLTWYFSVPQDDAGLLLSSRSWSVPFTIFPIYRLAENVCVLSAQVSLRLCGRKFGDAGTAEVVGLIAGCGELQ